jgi:hypothetical protein
MIFAVIVTLVPVTIIASVSFWMLWEYGRGPETNVIYDPVSGDWRITGNTR